MSLHVNRRDVNVLCFCAEVVDAFPYLTMATSTSVADENCVNCYNQSNIWLYEKFIIDPDLSLQVHTQTESMCICTHTHQSLVNIIIIGILKCEYRNIACIILLLITCLLIALNPANFITSL